ncbi:MAG TPA: hypothetical protein VK957_09405, partial [Lunatimonas sp.]|nr:hypothetical protein [Lunatimonas sp.]HSI76101.1 hypothetical protein [Lunatimonas sp.]
VLEKLPDLREKAFKILSREALASPMQLEEQYFSSYSVAKDYLQAHWPEEQQEAWQILQAETVESQTLVMV